MATGEARFSGFVWTPVGRREPTLAGLDLTVGAGERVLLVGPSGSGKSTVLHALVGALGGTIAGDSRGEVTTSGRVGLVPQNPLDSIVAERIGRDVAFGPENLGLSRDDIWQRVDESLAAVGLTQGRAHFTSALSGGEQQRLALAGVLAAQPDILLLDEPTAMLDESTATDVRTAVLEVVGERTMVVVEHRFEPWLPHVDRVVVLARGGQVSYDGPVPGFLARRPEGVWMPGAPPPTPVAVPSDLVAPQRPIGLVEARSVDVELVTRTLRATTRHLALRDFCGELRPGARTALLGPSGAGKSTALVALTGLLRPRAGTIVPDLSRRRSTALAADLGWVPQNPEIAFVTTSVHEEIGRTASIVGRHVDIGAITEVLGLSGLERAHPYRLSGGEQRRLALAAGLAHRPGLVALDEPTVGQDPGTWAAVVGWLAVAAEHGATVAFSTHDPHAPRDHEIRLSHPAVA